MTYDVWVKIQYYVGGAILKAVKNSYETNIATLSKGRLLTYELITLDVIVTKATETMVIGPSVTSKACQ